MTERRIGIGETSSFRYIAVEPPISNSDADHILKDLRLPSWIFLGTGWTQNKLADDTPYTEFWFDVGDGLDAFGEDVVDYRAVDLANQIGKHLEYHGSTVNILEGIVTTDFQTPIFGTEADENRAYLSTLPK